MATPQDYAAAVLLALAVSLVSARAQEATEQHDVERAHQSPHLSPRLSPHQSSHASQHLSPHQGSHAIPHQNSRANLHSGSRQSARQTLHACLNQKERRLAVEGRKVIHLGTAMRVVRSRVSGTLVRARLCHRQGHPGLVYVLTVLARDGKVGRLIVDAVKGTLVGEH